jgi:hypothetical protein
MPNKVIEASTVVKENVIWEESFRNLYLERKA